MRSALLAGVALALVWQGAGVAQTTTARITTPKEALNGSEPGDDYFLANYDQTTAYWKTLASQSDRMKLVSLGKSVEGRDIWMAVVSSPENIKNLEHHRQIAEKLALAKGLTDEQAHALAKEGKAFVWIDGGLHASEVSNAQTQIQIVYEMVSKNDPETLRFLNDTVMLFVLPNPDGQQLVADWYMRKPDVKARSLADLPVIYQRYVGHDNNREYYMSNQPETTAINRAMFKEWYPQIVYNEHQTGPLGAVVFVPPFRNPSNYHFDPLVLSELDGVSASIHGRLIAEDKPGSAERSAAPYSTWFNGGLRTTGYFHNVVGILTEIIGSPTPMQLPLVPARQLSNQDELYPVPPQIWHFRQTIEYIKTMNRATIDYASKNKEDLLYNRYLMGKNSIKRGTQDNWTITPKRVAAVQEAARAQGPAPRTRGGDGLAGNGDQDAVVDPKLYDTVFHAPDQRDPRGYILPPDQPDMPTTIKFLNALIKSGIVIDKATAPFTVNGKSYPAGSYVVLCDQAFRPHILDMFEPQDHPQDFEYPGGPPIKPYDITGYNLSYQMGVKYDRVLEGFSGPFQPVTEVMAPPPGKVVGTGGAGWILDHRTNNSFTLTNRLQKAKVPVFWLKDGVTAGGQTFGPGAVWVPASGAAKAIVGKSVGELGIDAYAMGSAPRGEKIALKVPRIGIVDTYGGLITSGWMQWVVEQFEFPYTLVYAPELDAGNLNAKYDVLMFVDGAIPGGDSRYGGGGGGFGRGLPKPEEVPEKYRKMLGHVTAEKTLPQIQAFVEKGGSAVAVGSSTRLGEYLHLTENGLTAPGKDGRPAPLPSTKFYIPGSILTAKVDNKDPLGYGFADRVDLFFDSSPVFKITDPAQAKSVSWFEGADPLRSGWAWGQKALDGTTGIVDASYGAGKVFLLGPEVAMRGQSYGSFKFVFNALEYGPAAGKTGK
ncbi:M14 metallopeptidase family protein [Phenylobacterium sp.]|uniref:M14 family metallopeptidase n=1 Tax=Phenylobacterium sp. TaxID=1871053 RepID=UPI00121F4300|nr:M14 metallopeptidase family protein [Phenylobacterium sp.]THD61005.1 MAG: peptidase [Phenylobacterium sp.]